MELVRGVFFNKSWILRNVPYICFWNKKDAADNLLINGSFLCIICLIVKSLYFCNIKRYSV
jgi:hypothetical protein